MPHRHHYHQRRHNIHVASELHPSVYRAAIGLAFWYVIAAWLLFGAAGYEMFALVMVTFVILAAIAIPAVVFFTGRSFREDHMGERRNAAGSFRDWLSGDFDTWQARISGRAAAIQILLPLAAVSIGLSVIGSMMFFATT